MQVLYGYHEDRKKQSATRLWRTWLRRWTGIERQVEFMLDRQKALIEMSASFLGRTGADGQKPATPTASEGLPRDRICRKEWPC
ncbi:hypothetical protein N7475_008575 [Penicillium sp. IBT 31633x]|nr:hypothetical protein N7475_008575 [Penicillium sp. IBT 31633x]